MSEQIADTVRLAAGIEAAMEALRSEWPTHPDGEVALGPRWIEFLAEVAVEAAFDTLKDGDDRG